MSRSISSLPGAILSFAFTGVMGPHERPAEQAPRVVSTSARVFLKPAR